MSKKYFCPKHQLDAMDLSEAKYGIFGCEMVKLMLSEKVEFDFFFKTKNMRNN